MAEIPDFMRTCVCGLCVPEQQSLRCKLEARIRELEQALLRARVHVPSEMLDEINAALHVTDKAAKP